MRLHCGATCASGSAIREDYPLSCSTSAAPVNLHQSYTGRKSEMVPF